MNKMRIGSEIMLLSLLTIITSLDHTNSEPTHEHQGLQICGGRLTGRFGVIQTPNFPNPFPVPIKCRWIIESDIDNGIISIFFTQQYITSGLTFTEYTFYDETSYKAGERLALTVTEDNITRINKLQVTSPVLVIDLVLNRLEGTQLRALGLLSMFGLNVTYTISDLSKVPDSSICSSAIECRLLGHCYARHDYKKFFCSCFEGYSGTNCGIGHLCSQAPNVCKNGGTCRQVGQVAVSCACAPGYSGELCESEISPECGIEECSEGCTEGTTCDCNSKETDALMARYEIQLMIAVQPNVTQEYISQEIASQIKTYLTQSKVAVEEIQVLNISKAVGSASYAVRVRLWATRGAAPAVRAALERLARPLRLHAPPHVDLQPGLNLHALMNTKHRSEGSGGIWEGSELILSCIAYGSPDIEFIWFKDGIKINFNGTTRDIWTRIVDENLLQRRTAVLGISDAKRFDSGKWSCAAVDTGKKRCRALRLSVLKPPEIQLEPSTLSVHKGQNVSITCLALVGRAYGALGFSWVKENTLLPLTPGREVWEDLYPAGSVLKLYNLQRSGEYRCQVSSVVGTNAKSVTIWALGADDIVCPAEASHGLRWTRTAPGAHAIASCPHGNSGVTTRFCEPKTNQHEVKWRDPDFSDCFSDSLKHIHDQFTQISLGYSWENITDVLRQYGSILRSLPTHPGQGAIPLKHCKDMLTYLLSSASNPKDRSESVYYLLNIFDILLKHPDSFMDEEKIYELQDAAVRAASMNRNISIQYNEFTVVSQVIRSNEEVQVKFHSTASEEWLISSVGIESSEIIKPSTVVAIVYHNLTERLPSLRRSLKIIDPPTIENSQSNSRNGREIEYILASHQIQLIVHESSNMETIKLLFTHIKNYTATATATTLACGQRTPHEPNTWNIKSCEIRVPQPSHAICRCQGPGTYALFTVTRTSLINEEQDLSGIVKITGGLGGALCLIAAVFQLLALIPGHSKLPVLLKVVNAGSYSAAIFTLLECDTRQDVACPGALGWICAACWCAGGAALCAQPLLLQAELAGRAQRISSVGLVAGVGTLAWLAARIWGGAPLQLGSAAQIVCATGCMLLTALCFVLTIYTKVRLRVIKSKVPAERKHYQEYRNKIVHHTLALLVTTSAVQIAGIAYAQPGAHRISYVCAISIAALTNGLAMLICYVIRDDECLRGLRRMLSLHSPKDWHHPARDTSLNLYIKQGQEVENRGGAGMLESLSSPVSPVTSYWRSPARGGPALHRKKIISDVEIEKARYIKQRLSPSRSKYDGKTACNLILQTPLVEQDQQVRCQKPVEEKLAAKNHTPLLSSPLHYEPYAHDECNLNENICNICVQSNPDVSRITSVPVKSCLKKPKSELSSSTSLPSINLKIEETNKSDIEQVNLEWNKAHSSLDSENVLNKISNDLDFLLNRTINKSLQDQIDEVPP